MLLMKITSFIFLVPGVLLVFLARLLVKKFKLEKNMTSNFEHEMNEAELEQYKLNKAVINVKMLGMIIALPGFILAIIAFR